MQTILLKTAKTEHQNRASALFKFGKSCQAQSTVYEEEASLVIDKMASKSIPKYRKEKCDAWSKDKLAIHFEATYFDHFSTIRYYVYPELVNESANTIISQLADSLLRLKTSKPTLKNVTITFDNHATQKNYYVVAYLQWQLKAGFLPANGCFYILYLLRGHTHNHLDAANKTPRMQYYKASALETPSDCVCNFN